MQHRNFEVPPPPQIQGNNIYPVNPHNIGGNHQGVNPPLPNQRNPLSFPNYNPSLNPQGNFMNPIPPNLYPTNPLPANPRPANPQPVYPRTEEIKDSSEKIACLKNGKVFEGLERQYNCKIDALGQKIKISSTQDSFEAIKTTITEKLTSLPFDKAGKWYYLDNTGHFVEYDSGINNIIEKKYKSMYLVIRSDSYQDYQEFVEFERQNNKYACYFAKTGGVHLQKMVMENSITNVNVNELLSNKDVVAYNFNHLTIREVRRRIDDEEEKLDRQLNYDWQWQHEDGNFRSYSYCANYIIENCYKNYLERNMELDSFAIIQGSNGTSYQIHFKYMTQYNESTRFARKIQRIDI